MAATEPPRHAAAAQQRPPPPTPPAAHPPLLPHLECPLVRVRAGVLHRLAVPLSRDGPERQITGVLLDTALDLLLRRHQAGRHRNGRRVLLGSINEQDWQEYMRSLPPRTTVAHDMSATGAKYIDHDMVLFPVNHPSHFFVAALDVATGEYQILGQSPPTTVMWTRPKYGTALRSAWWRPPERRWTPADGSCGWSPASWRILTTCRAGSSRVHGALGQREAGATGPAHHQSLRRRARKREKRGKGEEEYDMCPTIF
uniref:Ubiquitin-like protease family profile domain-containing protein n=1 Tax=Oryza meridionalis TaxID=40149 RepID=A0A0E0DQ69_9ORYZ